MRKFFIVLFVILFLVFGGCSSIGGYNNDPKQEDTSGYGLEASLKIYDDMIQRRQLMYTLSLYNSGLEPIVFNSENFRLSTKQVVSGHSGVSDVFTQESMDLFYSKIFDEGGELELVNERKEVSGILEIDESFFENLNNEELEFVLDLNYDYKTKFSNNLELKFDNGLYHLRVSDKISQAAPLQITKIELVPALEQDSYTLEYYISDMGKRSDVGPVTQIESYDITFRDDLLAGCRGTYENKRNVELDDIVVKNGESLILECPVRLVEGGSFNTKTFGEFYYNYKMRFEGKVELPRES